MGKTLYQFKTKNPSYNIEFVNVKRERYVAQELKIRMIPTQMIFDGEGNIVFKNVGLLTTQQLKDLFKKYKFK
jgi:thioredoxin 1